MTPLPTPNSSSQTLITGVYRSGTEFVSVLLAGHPRLSSTMYHVNAMRFVDDDGRVDVAIASMLDRLRRRYGLSVDAVEVAKRHDEIRARTGCPSWAALYDAFMTALWLSAERRHWVEKCQLLWREIPRFLAGMPNGRAILVIRDPRGVTASFKAYTYAPPPAYLGAVFNCLDALRHAELFRRALPAERFLLVRWEDAVREPDATAARMFDFLGLDPAPGGVDPSRWTDQRGGRWIANSVGTPGSDGGFDLAAAMNRWRDGLDERDLSLIEAVCGGEMRRFGYEPSGVATAVDWPAVARRLSSDDRVAAALRRWELTGEGMEAFPTDPRDPANWAESRHSSEGDAGGGAKGEGQSTRP